ncbi:hypothetical protein DAEQUDRAFT_215600 [Daedalea quercina L-15889]|uniref:Uncharacterized protein n=1 Tax=Daedalea quercina L-15889 TaxID=1314783 RepID=A0A165R405_9APHY|nr:hypothetical protein DAEQUDRAFT_215600 [Daedalea quercina L-15889]
MSSEYVRLVERCRYPAAIGPAECIGNGMRRLNGIDCACDVRHGQASSVKVCEAICVLGKIVASMFFCNDPLVGSRAIPILVVLLADSHPGRCLCGILRIVIGRPPRTRSCQRVVKVTLKLTAHTGEVIRATRPRSRCSGAPVWHHLACEEALAGMARRVSAWGVLRGQAVRIIGTSTHTRHF